MFENPLAVFVLIDLTIITYFQLLIIQILLDTLNQGGTGCVCYNSSTLVLHLRWLGYI